MLKKVLAENMAQSNSAFASLLLVALNQFSFGVRKQAACQITRVSNERINGNQHKVSMQGQAAKMHLVPQGNGRK